MKTHTEWMNEVMSDERYKEEYKVAVQTLPNGAVIRHPDKYKKEYDLIAYNTMCQEDATLTHVAVVLHCSKPTLLSWIKRHPSFRNAIQAGRQVGEVAFRNKIRDHAFSPTSDVNNGLIKLIAKNVHGIDDSEAQVIINNNIGGDSSGATESAKLYAEAMGRMNDVEFTDVESDDVDPKQVTIEMKEK